MDTAPVAIAARMLINRAIVFGQMDLIVQSLKDGSTDLDGDERMPPLHTAAALGRLEAIDLLLPHVEVNHYSRLGSTALHLAAAHGHAEVVRRLLAYGAHPDLRDHDGKTALHLASEASFAEATRALLDGGANPMICDDFGRIPLHNARLEWSQDLIERMTGHGCATAEDQEGHSALTSQARGGHWSTVLTIVTTMKGGCRIVDRHGHSAYGLAEHAESNGALPWPVGRLLLAELAGTVYAEGITHGVAHVYAD